MTSSQDGLQYLKIIGANGIIVYGKILINGKITSWDILMRTLSNKTLMALSDVAMCNLVASEGAEIINSEFGYLGYVEPDAEDLTFWEVERRLMIW